MTRETGILLPNNQRRYRTSHVPKDVLPLRMCADGQILVLGLQFFSTSLGSGYRGTSRIRKIPLVGPYSRTMPRVLWWS